MCERRCVLIAQYSTRQIVAAHMGPRFARLDPTPKVPVHGVIICISLHISNINVPGGPLSSCNSGSGLRWLLTPVYAVVPGHRAGAGCARVGGEA